MVESLETDCTQFCNHVGARRMVRNGRELCQQRIGPTHRTYIEEQNEAIEYHDNEKS